MTTKTTSYYTANVNSYGENIETRRRKLLIFKTGTLHLALPVESVKKITHYTPIQGSGVTAVGLIHVDEMEITAIDLHKRLFKVSQPPLSGRQFLILAKNSVEELFGILVSQTPSLLELPLNQIRTLPDSYRRGDTLEIASHVTRVQDNDQLLTVFILDVDRLVPPMGMENFAF
ncbi:chemotaxis protein CheW [Cyanothece sp. BG0011]|uniref:chemotaxis protein CheW n=1 Tax=Cyanothece sp. BG0011 TaxID=2082950 RepID=UPI000D1F1D89|nr:chemotaxis protein CheW [Cyanothece sp. BG0011]